MSHWQSPADEGNTKDQQQDYREHEQCDLHDDVDGTRRRDADKWYFIESSVASAPIHHAPAGDDTAVTKPLPRTVFLILCAMVSAATLSAQRPRSFSLKSPDTAATLMVEVGEPVTYGVSHRGKALLSDSPISLSLGSRILGKGSRVRETSQRQAGGTPLGSALNSGRTRRHSSAELHQAICQQIFCPCQRRSRTDADRTGSFTESWTAHSAAAAR